MNPSFDLLESPWVPCIDGDGHPLELSLRDVLVRAGDVRELYGESSLVTAALYRLLLAVLHRIFGPRDWEAWAALWKAERWDPDRLDAYFEQWHHRFDLFDPQRPFYQTPDERVKPKSVASLIHDVASGNNATLFDHHTDAQGPVLTPAQAVRMLVAAQVFGLAGLSGLSQKFTDGACASGIVFLIQGGDLFETLALNLLQYPTEDDVMVHGAQDRLAWEMDDPFTPERTRPLGYLDYLTWQNRRVLLLPEEGSDGVVVRQMTMAPALRLDSSVLDPMTHYRVDEKRGPIPLPFIEERALWRDSSALFQLQHKGYRPPLTFHWVAELVDEGYLDRFRTRRYLALGMSKKQAKVNFFRSERLPLPLRYLREEALVESLEEALTMAEGTARQLWGAARTLATFTLSPEADTESGRQPVPEDLKALTSQWAIERGYWPRLEHSFRRVMETLPDDREEALAAWRDILRRTAWDAFDQVADSVGFSPSGLKAVVRARDQLAAGLGKALPV
jgi:CRISPR system Cascade subunit CasA